MIKNIFLSLYPVLLCLILVLPGSYHLFDRPLFVGHDFTHVGRITEMVNTIRSGQIPPRWSQNLGFGYGMPLFSFYAPLPYYVGSLFVLAGLQASLAVSLLFFLSMWGSSVAMFYITRNNRAQILVPMTAAAMFAYLPYRAVDMYVRGALGELWGIWLLLVVLLALKWLFKNPGTKPMIIYSIALGLFLLSHNLMILMGIPLILFYCLVWILKDRSKIVRYSKYVFLGSALGFGLAAFFLLPMFFEKQYTSVFTLSNIDGGFSKHFVYWKQLFSSPFGYGGSIEGIHDGISFALGQASWIVLSLGIIVLIHGIRNGKKRRKVVLSCFWLLVIVASLFLTSTKSIWLWNTFAMLSYIQFPWRFLSITLIALPMFFIGTLQIIKNSNSKKIISVVIFTLLLFEVKNFAPNPDPTDGTASSRFDIAYIQNNLSKSIPDYIHPNLSEIVTDANRALKPVKSRFEAFPATSLTVQKDTASHAWAIIPPIKEPTLIRANIFEFPGWQWSIDGVPVSHAVGASLPVMEYRLDPSTSPREIRVFWTETTLRSISNQISLVSWLIVALYLLFSVSNLTIQALKSLNARYNR